MDGTFIRRGGSVLARRSADPERRYAANLTVRRGPARSVASGRGTPPTDGRASWITRARRWRASSASARTTRSWSSARPNGFTDRLAAQVGDEAVIHTDLTDAPLFDVIVAFVTWRVDLEGQLDLLRARMAPACGLWIAWPKRASKVPTDMTDHVIREIALPTGLVDNKVCAIDEIWTGLRLVIRRELR